MDTQLLALGKCILVGDLRFFVDARITTEFFRDEKYAKVYQFLLDHWARFGETADERVVKLSFPNLDLVDDRQPTSYFIHMLREQREEVLQLAALQEVGAVLNNLDEPDRIPRIRRILYDHLSTVELETSGSRDNDLTLTNENIRERLEMRRDNTGLRGYPTGFDTIDLVTGGLQPEQFTVITGVPKSGKSSFLLKMALWLWQEVGEIPLFIGFEMSNAEQEDRLLSLLSHVSLTNILNGDFTKDEWERVQQWIDKLPTWQSFFLSADITSGMTVNGIAAKIHKYRPAAVFIDGMYLMSAGDEKLYPRGTPQALTLISRETKKLAQAQRLPIVGTTQSLVSRSRGGLGIHSLGYTSAWGQDADVILGVERNGDTNISKFHVIDSRSGPRVDSYIAWDWNTGTVGEVVGFSGQASGRSRRTTGVFDD